MNEVRHEPGPVPLGTIALALALILLSGGCDERIAPVDGPPIASTTPAADRFAEVERERVELFEVASGTVSSARHATISSKILARIESITVRAGDEIEADTLLVQLDDRDLEARLNAAREGAAGAKAALALAASERGRIAGLFESKVASRKQLDRAEANLRMARAELEAAIQGITNAEVAASHAEIRSPVAGRVIDRLAEPGDTAAPGAPLLRIYDPGSMRLEAAVRETLAVRLVPGQPLSVNIEALGLALQGEIDEIVPAAEPGARTFLVKVRLPHDPRLFSGMFGRVSIPAGEAERFRIPRNAMERIGQLEYVYVLDRSDVPRRRLITSVGIDARDVEVLSGLREGERVALR